MKKTILIALTSLLSFACNKSTTESTNQVEIKIIHHTCVQTVAKVVTPNTTYGVNWAKGGVLHNNAFNVGILNPIRVDSVNQVFKVNILNSATLPQIICAMADIAGTGVTFDIEKL